MKRTYSRGELYYADLGMGVGSEQNGYRPVVIIQNDIGNRHSPTTIVAAVSTQIKSKAKLAHPLLRFAYLRACTTLYHNVRANPHHRQD